MFLHVVDVKERYYNCRVVVTLQRSLTSHTYMVQQLTPGRTLYHGLRGELMKKAERVRRSLSRASAQSTTKKKGNPFILLTEI